MHYLKKRTDCIYCEPAEPEQWDMASDDAQRRGSTKVGYWVSSEYVMCAFVISEAQSWGGSFIFHIGDDACIYIHLTWFCIKRGAMDFKCASNIVINMCVCVFQHWEVFKVITEVFILVPALVGLKGNLEMTLAARLSTAVMYLLIYLIKKLGLELEHLMQINDAITYGCSIFSMLNIDIDSSRWKIQITICTV